MFNRLRLAVIVPAYNEANKIGRTVRGLPRWIDHVVVVDDASQDATSARAAEGRRPRLEVLRHSQNRGVGAAIATGYARALELGVDAAVVMAGDGQMDPADLPLLLEPIARGRADYVKGNRFRAPGLAAMPKSRLVGNVLLSLATRVTSGYWHVFDSQCGYTAASQRALEVICASGLFPRYGYPNDLLARLNVERLVVEDVPVRAVYGPEWRSGIRPVDVVYPITWVLLRSWARRVLAQAKSGPLRVLQTQPDSTGSAEPVARPSAACASAS